ncbi:MAG: glycosyltransferase family A protein [Spirochaetaceae bacterium]|nr:glycosyltransferase family A protein [Spirochaetaceae bacterium]
MSDVSVVIPAYRAAATIGRAIESALEQEYSAGSLEVIVVVDGDVDETATAARSLLARYPGRLQVVVQDNTGPAAARNAGIAAARGAYIAFLDADDAWLPGKISAQVRALDADHSLTMIGCAMNGRLFRGKSGFFLVSFRELLFRNYFSTSCTVVRREAIIAAGCFDASRRLSEDYETWLRIVRNGKAAVLNESYVSYATGGISSRLWRMERAELATIAHATRSGGAGPLVLAAALVWSLMRFALRAAKRVA